MGTNFYWHEKAPCEHCGRTDGEGKHIGKSSMGWVFALHVYPEDGITDLLDWIDRFFESPHIFDEYGQKVPVADMIERIVMRGSRDGHPKDFAYSANHAVPGPRGLVRAKVDHRTRHGAGTWDCHTGDFS